MKIPLNIILKLLTGAEIKALQKRYKIINLLKTSATYREIAKKMGISTATVVHVNKRIKVRNKKKPLKVSVYQAKAKKKRLPWIIG